MPLTPSEAFSENNPVPKNIQTLEELWNWFKPLIEAENVYWDKIEAENMIE